MLASTIVSVFEASADVLNGGPVPDLNSLEQARAAHRTALDAWAGAQLRAGASAESVLDGLDYDHPLRVLSYVALAVGANAAIVAGRHFEPGSARIPFEAPVQAGLGPTLRRMSRTLTTHLSWTSPLLHTSIRAALGLALAVLVARLFGLEHAFWVVLGTMSVLRSNALATGRTTVQALAGTLLGFAVGGLFTLMFASNPFALWVAAPVAVFLAAYAPSAVSFVAGQAAFTVLLLILFNLLAPAGWKVGLVRIEDVAVGSAIGVVAGTLLWPRGARSDFAHSLSGLYRLVAVHLSEALNLVLGSGRVEAVNATRAQVWQAREKAGESFDQLLGLRRERLRQWSAAARQRRSHAGGVVVHARRANRGSRCCPNRATPSRRAATGRGGLPDSLERGVAATRCGRDCHRVDARVGRDAGHARGGPGGTCGKRSGQCCGSLVEMREITRTG